MATTHNLYTLSNATATRLTPPGIHSGMDITIQNVNTEGYIYLGGEGVTALNYGYRLNPNNAVAWELPEKDTIYAIADTNGLEAAVLKTSLEK